LKKADIQTIPLLLLSAAALTVIQAPINMHLVAWVALVPFLLAVCSDVPARRLFIWSYVIGTLYWLGNTYWLMNVTAGGWVAMAPYFGVYWLALAFGLRLANYRGVPLWLSVPVFFTGAEALQGWIGTGFPWRYLAHSQYANLRIIQIADIFGAAGVSFLVALVNAAVASVILSIRDIKRGQTPRLQGQPQEKGSDPILRDYRSTFVPIVMMVAAIGLTMVYGNYRVSQSQHTMTVGPMVASVQPNVPQRVKESGKAGEAILADLIKDSEQSLSAHPALIVWPETMVMAYLNPELLACLPRDHEMRREDSEIRDLAARGVYVLAGAPAATPLLRNGQIELGDKFNSAFLYTPEGKQSPLRYDKMHLVPFGEFVPFRHSIPPLYRLLMWFTPYEYEYTLTEGKELTRFQMAVPNGSGERGQIPRLESQPQEKRPDPISAADRTYHFGVLICYEDTTPEVARRLVYGKNGKELDFLVNISNDGWFTRETPSGPVATAELSQHTAICVFRAVENRVSIVRSVNTGISTTIDPVGRILNDPPAGTLPKKTFERQAVSGWYADNVPLDSRSTFFGGHGRWLDFCCGTAFAASIMLPVLTFLRKRRSKSAT
jgi:apolipoprotein N-acyltransferase